MRPRTIGRRPAQTEKTRRRHRPDYWLPLLCSALLVIGLIVLYSISPGLAVQGQVSENYFVSRQLIAIAMGVVAFFVFANIPISFWRRNLKVLIVLAAGSAVAVRLFGEQVNGAYRWVHIGELSFQSVELIKFALLIWLAVFLTNRIKEGTLADLKRTFKPLFIVLLILGAVVAYFQSDLGSTGVMVVMMAAMAFVAGLPMKRILLVGGVMLIGVVAMIAASDYRRDRMMTYVNPGEDCQSSGYQVCQALIAVGSGGMFGLGLAHSVQAYGYLPEAANDSIFAILAEKFGFIGVTVLAGLYIAFFTRMFKIAERAPDDFSRLLVVGILAWLSTQAIINIGAMIGLLPLKGITLPLISYGGTSLLFVTGAIGLVFQISRYTTYGPAINEANNREGKKSYESTLDRRGDRRPHYATVSRRPQA